MLLLEFGFQKLYGTCERQLLKLFGFLLQTHKFVVADKVLPSLAPVGSNIIKTGDGMILESLRLVLVKVVVVFGHQSADLSGEDLILILQHNDEKIREQIGALHLALNEHGFV